MSTQAIDLHEELAEAKVGKFHWRLGAMMGLLTLFDGYDTFNPAYVIHYVAKPWGLQAGQAGLLISSGLVGFLLGRCDPRHHRRPSRPPRHPARGPVDHQHLYAAHRDVGGFVPVVLHPARSDRHRSRRAAAFGDDLHQRAGAATRCEHVRAVGRRARLGARRNARRCRRRVRDAGVRLDLVVLDRVAVVPAASLHALHVAGITEIPCPSRPHRRNPRHAQQASARARQRLQVRRISGRTVRKAGQFGGGAAPAQISPDHVRDLGVGVPQPVLHLRPVGLDSDRDDAARRNLCRKLRLRRADADHVVRRRSRARASRRQVRQQPRADRDLVGDRRRRGALPRGAE